MNLTGCEGELLRRLAEMPFLDRMELAAVSGWSKGAVYRGVRRLEEGGLAAPVPHATDLIPLTGRFHLTAAGLRLLAQWDGMSVDELLRTRPVSARWRRILLERLDAVAAVYRLASAVSNIAYPMRFRWYRAAPMDAAIELSGGRTLAVVRQGLAADRTGFAKRVWRLWEGPIPGAVLVLVPDEARLRHARRLLTGAPAPAMLALERDAVLAAGGERVWHLPSIAAAIDLGSALDRIRPGGALPVEPQLSEASLPWDIPAVRPGRDLPDHMLPALLKPAEKRALDLLSDWPWISRKDLAGLMDVSEPRVSQLVTPLEGFGLAARLPADEAGVPGPPPTPGPHRRGAGGAGPQGPRLRGRGEEALERHPRRPGSPPLLAQRVGRGKQAASQERGAHHGGAWLHRGPGPAVPLPGLEAGPDRPAAKGVEVLQARRPARAGGRAALRPPRRLRHPAQGPDHVALLPGVGAPRRAARDDGGTARPIPALLLLPPSPRRPRRTARRPRRLRRRPGGDPLPAGGKGGDGQDPGPSPPVGLPQGDSRRPGASGTGLAHSRRLGARPRPPGALNIRRGTGVERRLSPRPERRFYKAMGLDRNDESAGPRRRRGRAVVRLDTEWRSGIGWRCWAGPRTGWPGRPGSAPATSPC